MSFFKFDSRGQDVVQVQSRLKSLGYFSADATGYFGKITMNAVMDFQEDNMIKKDGIVGPSTYKKLYASNQNSSAGQLKIGSSGNNVREIQDKLKQLGYFNMNPTGFYGEITKQAVQRYQRDQKLTADGIVGQTTYGRLLDTNTQVVNSRGSDRESNGLISWFGGVENIFPRNSDARVTDILTGISFSVRRTGGYNHADAETLTVEDTNKLRNIFGGKWSWNRRAVVVEAGGIRIAGSMAGMPHDFDRVGNNGMNGHFDIHFLNSKTHGTNRLDAAHQQKVKEAANFLGEK